MSHNNRLSQQAEQAWRETLTEPSLPDDLHEPAPPVDVPDLGATDTEYLDDLCATGKR